MNDISHTSDILDQLKSLSIDRVDSPIPIAPPPRRGRSYRRTVAALALLVAGAGAAWHFDLRGQEAVAWVQGLAATSPADTAQAVPVPATATPAPAAPVPAAAPSVVGSGYVVADRELALMPEIGGRVQAVFVETGSAFEAGQVIAQLDTDIARTDLRIAEANLSMAEVGLARAEASVAEARADLDRQQRLLDRGSAPAAQIEAARFALLRSERDVDVAAQGIAVARLEVDKRTEALARHSIVAPFAGVVVARHLNPGDFAVSAMDGGPDQAIATLIDPEALTIAVDVAEGNLANVAPGQTATIELDAYPGRTFAATVQTIAPKVSIQKGTVEVRLGFDHPPMGVFANMAAKVTFGTADQTASLQQIHQKGQ